MINHIKQGAKSQQNAGCIKQIIHPVSAEKPAYTHNPENICHTGSHKQIGRIPQHFLHSNQLVPFGYPIIKFYRPYEKNRRCQYKRIIQKYLFLAQRYSIIVFSDYIIAFQFVIIINQPAHVRRSRRRCFLQPKPYPASVHSLQEKIIILSYLHIFVNIDCTKTGKFVKPHVNQFFEHNLHIRIQHAENKLINPLISVPAVFKIHHIQIYRTQMIILGNKTLQHIIITYAVGRTRKNLIAHRRDIFFPYPQRKYCNHSK
ncbi:MAG TPA: hypothetical protein DCZ40_03070 [Lachnospiraceae bacterium]|nr:hypothetical protein [Lachnospiraceae bacterium]